MLQMRLLISFSLLLLLHGCSSAPRYVISNNTAEIITIHYSYPAYPDAGSGYQSCPIEQRQAFPETAQGKLSRDSVEWQKLSAGRYIFNEAECSIQVAIIAGASVTIATHDPFKDNKGITSSVNAELVRLKIANERANIILTDEEVFARFEQIGEKLFVYAFP